MENNFSKKLLSTKFNKFLFFILLQFSEWEDNGNGLPDVGEFHYTKFNIKKKKCNRKKLKQKKTCTLYKILKLFKSEYKYSTYMFVNNIYRHSILEARI